MFRRREFVDRSLATPDEGEALAPPAVPAARPWPPRSKHPPIERCLVCGGEDLVETSDSAIMFTVKDRPEANYVDYPVVINIVVCNGCGHLELFANEWAKFLTGYSWARQARSVPED